MTAPVRPYGMGYAPPGILVIALPARGEVWGCEMAEAGRRPVVVLSRDAVISRHRRVLVAPWTTTTRGLFSGVVLEICAALAVAVECAD